MKNEAPQTFREYVNRGSHGKNGVFFCLAAHFEARRQLSSVDLKLFIGWWSLERRVVAHRSEQWIVVVLILAILPEAFLSKLALGVLSLVDRPLPAFVGPRGGAETNEW